MVRRGKPCTTKDVEYLRSVAGSMPAEAIAAQMNRTLWSVRNIARNHCISLRISKKALEQYWRDYGKARA